jgi:hypothetical protein
MQKVRSEICFLKVSEIKDLGLGEVMLKGRVLVFRIMFVSMQCEVSARTSQAMDDERCSHNILSAG